ncbi:hypothetical protein DICVIV_02865 [Dictyocaulus viviparus]|uniref:Kelch repeat protein n=1 Tax=Dictyocaulus viviparus TaxID=29172 RepID=A0A0D8Y487_DICVI|nr:hypothetical protein DICVIV_02865 [Dictyocaulus viviparus]
MAPRGLHTMVYHEKECAMYVFGGEAPDWRLQSDSCGPASFNDLWRLDMLPTTNDGPNLAGHASCMHGDLFIVQGGEVSTCEVSYRVSVLDMQSKRWFHAPLPGFPTVLHRSAVSSIPRLAPLILRNLLSYYKTMDQYIPYYFSFVVGSSSLIVLREGCLLATGENMRDNISKNISILFVFDPKDPERVQWQYKLIPGIGRWWPPVGLSPPPSNRNFGGIAVICCDRLIRLVSLGIPQKGSKDSRCNIIYDSVQKRTTDFIKFVRCILEAEMSRREQMRRYCFENNTAEKESSDKLSEVIHQDGIYCELGRCYLSAAEVQNCKEARFLCKPRTIDLVTITVAVDPHTESQRLTPLDEVDISELKLRLRTMIAQLHMKYYSTRPDVLLSPNLPSRNSSFRRMVVFTAEIPVGEELDPLRDLQIIEWIPQIVQYGGPPETRKYCLVAARGEVVLHGGNVHFGNGMGMMGYTYLMTPVHSKPFQATSLADMSHNRFDFKILVIQ